MAGASKILAERERSLQAERATSLAQLCAERDELRTQNTKLQEKLCALRQEVQELQRRLGLNGSNSGKPPAAPRTRSQRRPSGKRPGGQRGTTLRQSASPQRTVSHLPTSCAQCGAAFSAADMVGEPQRRQVFELPPPPPLEGTEHPAQACRCGQCGRVTRAVFPAGVNAPAQYGERLALVRHLVT